MADLVLCSGYVVARDESFVTPRKGVSVKLQSLWMDRANADADFVSRAQAGDVNAFHGLFEKYIGTVYPILIKAYCSTAEAEMLTERVFLQAFRHIKTLPRRGAFSALIDSAMKDIVFLHHLRTHPSTLSIDGLVELAAKPLRPHRAMPKLRPRNHTQGRKTRRRDGWTSMLTTFARFRRVAKWVS